VTGDLVERLKAALADRYTIEHEIGSGGMATVYLAEDLKHRRQVAIKVMRPELAASIGAERFLREIRISAQLNHPNILTLLDSGEADGLLYYAMPYVEGESLRERLVREQQLPLEEAVQITQEVADGLSYAHSMGVVHRDIKPENILLSGGHAVIADFGIARAVTEAGGEKLTETGIAVGTPAYMSPEQAVGRGQLDARSDIYSLGVVLYEMLVGDPPFVGSSAQAILARKSVEPVPSLRTVRETVSVGTERVVLKALAKLPADRYATAAAFSEALTAPSGEIGSEWVTPEPAPGAPAQRRKTRRLVGAAAVIASLVVGGTWTVWQVRSSPAESLSPNVIAILPFTVRGSEDVAYLGEGMVDLLSVILGGSGEQRSVDPNALLSFVSHEVDGTLDPQSGRAVAQHFGAGRYLLGTIVESGGQLRVQATLYDAAEEQKIVAVANVGGTTDALFSLVNRLTAEILVDPLQGPGGHLARVASLTTDSIEALKAYLEGERALRAPRDRDAARVAFQRAVEIDSTFALAWSRLAFVVGWSWATDPTFDYLDRAQRHSDRLSERERLLLRGFSEHLHGRLEEAEQAFLAIVQEYPDDVLAWQRLGVVNYFYGWKRGRPVEDARVYLERPLALDTGNLDPYWLLAIVSRFEGKHDEAERHQRRFFSGEDDIPARHRAAGVFATDDSLAEEQVIDELRDAAASSVLTGGSWVAQHTDDLPGARRIARLLTDVTTRPPEDRVTGHLMLAHFAAEGGQWSAAKQQLSAAEALCGAPSIVFRAALAAAPFWQVPRGDLEASREQLRAWDGSAATLDGDLAHPFLEGVYPLLRTYLLGLVSARLGDDSLASEYAAEVAQLQGPENVRALPQDLSRGIHAQVAVNQGRLEDALALLEQASMEGAGSDFMYTMASSFVMQNHERFLRAELLRQLGREQEALGWYSSFQLGRFRTVIYRGPTHLRRGEIHEQMGDPEKALEHYGHFVALWSDADPEMQPLVDDVRGRIARLAAR